MKVFICGVFALFFHYIALAEVYKWTDEHGRVQFGDRLDPNVAAQQKPVIIKNDVLSHEASNTSVLPYPESLKLSIRQLFLDKEFTRLNQLLEQYQQSTDGNIQNEDILFAAYEVFKVQDPSYIRLFENWLNATPGRYPPYLARASYYYQQGWDRRGGKWSSETSEQQFSAMRQSFDVSRNNIDQALKINQKLTVPYCYMMCIASVTGMNHQNRIIFKRAISHYPASYRLRQCFLKTISPRWGGSFYEMQVSVDGASRYHSKNPKLKLLEGLLYVESGEGLSIKKDYKEAEKVFTQALKYGDNHLVYFNRGKARYRSGNFIQALHDLNRAIDMSPENARYYYWRAKAYEESGQHDSAVTDIKLSQKYDPFDTYTQKYMKWYAGVLYKAGYDLYIQRLYGRAIDHLDLAISLFPSHAEYYYWRSKVNIDQNKRQQAYTDLKKAIELDKSNFNYYLLMDWLLARKNNWPEIISYWDQYITIEPDNSRAYLERGGAYYRKGDIKSAVNNARKSADMGNLEGKQAYEKFRHLVNE